MRSPVMKKCPRHEYLGERLSDAKSALAPPSSKVKSQAGFARQTTSRRHPPAELRGLAEGMEVAVELVVFELVYRAGPAPGKPLASSCPCATTS